MKTFITLATTAALLAHPQGAAAWSSVNPLSRRDAIQATFAAGAATVVAGVSVLPANAMPSEETPRTITRMGGLLVRFWLLNLLCHGSRNLGMMDVHEPTTYDAPRPSLLLFIRHRLHHSIGLLGTLPRRTP